MEDEKQRTEKQRWDDCLSGEHDYEPGEVPDYIREWVKVTFGVELRETRTV